ncbi:MAG: N-acetyltransferase [Candidatus Enteromonas sp.]
MNIRPVCTKKEIKDFIEFPLKLYKNNPYFVPCFYGDEKAMFKKDYLYRDQAEYESWVVYDGKKVVGRVTAILQLASNAKWKQKRVRLNRFDCIDSQEVADLLLSTVEAWAKEKGMEEVVGPLGFSDMEREGLLIEGFDYLNTFEEQYNAPYYQTLIENRGYVKEIDWLEHRIFPKKERDPRMHRIAEAVMRRYHLHFAPAKSKKDFIKRYGDELLGLCEKTYENLYMTVPFTDNIKKNLIKSFLLIIDLRFVALVLNEEEKPVCFGLMFPSIGEAIQKSGGRLTLPTLFKILKAIKKPTKIDFALIGVDPSYVNMGVPAILFDKVQEYLAMDGLEYFETNLNLENNQSILNMWKEFDNIQHKRRRSYIKKI